MTVQATGGQRPARRGKAVVALLLAGAVAVALYAWRQAATHPSSDDASIDADVVHVAASVGGRVMALPLQENAMVQTGQVVFQIDPVPYEYAVHAAEADLALAQAVLESRLRAMAAARANAVIAADQVGTAQSRLDLATRSVARLRPLAERSFIPQQQLDTAETARHDAAIQLAQAEQARVAAEQLIGTDAVERAAIDIKKAALDIARRALSQTVVRAPHEGRVSGLKVLSGEVVIPGQSLFTLIATKEWFIVANFREGELAAIKPGDCATGYVMIDRTKPLHATVDSIGYGVFDDATINLPRALPYVQRTMNWVRIAQRFPVRLRLEAPPPELMRAGASAVIEIGHGAACR